MRKIIRLIRLPLADKFLFVWALLWIASVHLALRFFAFSDVYRWISRRSPVRNRREKDASLERVIWAVDTAGNILLPERPCLTKALVGQRFLNRLGYETSLRIGVRHEESKSLEAHAWLEYDNEIIIGDLRDLSTFTPFPSLTLDIV